MKTKIKQNALSVCYTKKFAYLIDEHVLKLRTFGLTDEEILDAYTTSFNCVKSLTNCTYMYYTIQHKERLFMLSFGGFVCDGDVVEKGKSYFHGCPWATI